jgi:hypothetical protein
MIYKNLNKIILINIFMIYRRSIRNLIIIKNLKNRFNWNPKIYFKIKITKSLN